MCRVRQPSTRTVTVMVSLASDGSVAATRTEYESLASWSRSALPLTSLPSSTDTAS